MPYSATKSSQRDPLESDLLEVYMDLVKENIEIRGEFANEHRTG